MMFADKITRSQQVNSPLYNRSIANTSFRRQPFETQLRMYVVLGVLTVVGLISFGFYFWETTCSVINLLKLLTYVKMHSFIHSKGSFSFVDVVEDKFDSEPGNTVQFITAETGLETTVQEVEQLANRVAHWGLKQGCKQLDTVAIMMLNCPEFVSLWLGFAKVGVSAALLNTNSVGSPFVHSCQVALESSRVKILIVDTELRARLAGELEQLEALGVSVLCWSSSSGAATDQHGSIVHTIRDEVLMCSSARPARQQRDVVRERDPLLFIFTSGTTGLPKACRISQTKYYLASLPYRLLCGLGPADRIYTTMPMYHSAAGMLGVGSALTSGACLVIRKKFSASAFTADCIKYRVTTFQYIGELCRYLLSSPPSAAESQLRIRYAFGNGLRPDIWQQFQRRFRVQHVVEFYGATEANAGLINNLDRVGALGFIPRFLDVLYPLKILRTQPDDQTQPYRDPATGHCVECKPNEVGLLVCQISSALDRRFDGYTDAKASSAKVLQDVRARGDKFFNTGDLLSRDWLGFYYWSDRVGDTFRWKGENVATSEVAHVLLRCPGVKDCAVFGVEVPGADGRAGMAVVVPQEDTGRVDEVLAEVLATCKTHLAPYARPLFLRVKAPGAELPVTTTFKHVKGDLLREGFDPARVVDDALFMFSAADERYVPLSAELHERIASKQLRL